MEQTLENNLTPSDAEANENNVGLYEKEQKVGALAADSDLPVDKLDFLLDIPVEITVEVGRTRMLISDLLKLGHGSIIELSKLSGENMEVLANRKLIAKGEVVSVDSNYGIRVTEIITPKERVESLK